MGYIGEGWCGKDKIIEYGLDSDSTISLIAPNTTHPLTMKMPIFRSGLTLVIILLLVLTTGCMEKSTPEQGIRQQSPEEEEVSFHPLTFEEGINLMNMRIYEDLMVKNGTFPLYYIHGRGINSEGKAEEWIFGTIVENEFFFVIVESNQQTLIPYQTNLPKRAVDIQKITLPDDLITRNSGLIRKTFSSNDSVPLLRIELMDDTYTIAPSTASVNRILYFNALTGEQSNP